MLTNLSLTNFKRHESFYMPLTPGLNLITGANYKGKSTVLQAIRYALEGATAIPGGKAVATNRNAKDHAVELDFEADGHTYTVYRSSKKVTLKRDGEVIAMSASAVTNHLEEVLGMAGQLYSKLRYGKQKETEALLTLGAGELHKIIGEVSRVEVVNQVIDKCTAAINQCNGGMDVLPDVDVAGLERKIEDAKATMDELHKELTSLVDNININNTKLSRAKDELHNLELSINLINTANDERDRLAEDEVNIARELGRAKVEVVTYGNAGEQLEEIRDMMESNREKIQALTITVSELKAVQKAFSQLNASHDATARELDKFRELEKGHSPEIDISSLQDMLDAVDSELAIAKSKEAETAAAFKSGVCPTCKRPYEHGPEWLQRMEKEAAGWKSKVAELEVERKKAARQLESAKLNNESMQKVKDRITSLRDTLDSQQESVHAMEMKLAGLTENEPEESLAAANADQDRLSEGLTEAATRATQLTIAQTQVKELEKRQAQINSRLQELGPLELAPSTTEAKEKVSELDALLADLNSEYRPKADQYTALTGEFNSTHAMLTAAQQQHQKRMELEKRLTVATSLVKYLRKNRDRFMSRVWDGVMAQASQFASNATGGAISEVSRGDNGKFTYMEDGHEMPIQAASGAQRSIMGLGVQLAMANMLPSSLPVLMLDEPGSDMDAEHSLSLSTLLAADHNQLIMVSHRELDGAVADNVVTL